MAHIIIPSVNVMIVKGSKVLLSRRANTGWMDGHLCLPGGHVKKGETPIMAVLREIKEELGQDVKREDLEYICTAARKSTVNEYVAYEFAIKNKTYKFKNAEPEICSELVWAKTNNLPDDLIDDFRQIIEQCLVKGKNYLELGYEK